MTETSERMHLGDDTSGVTISGVSREIAANVHGKLRSELAKKEQAKKIHKKHAEKLRDEAITFLKSK
jgi:hypothetical protein